MVTKESIEVIAQSIGLSTLSPEVSAALAPDVEYRVREVMEVLPYDILMVELDITNVHELEDFLIKCMYRFAAGRDLRPRQLGNMMNTLENWLSTSEDLLVLIQHKIKWADSMSEVRNRKEVEERVEEVKKNSFHEEVAHCGQADVEFRGHEEIFGEPSGVMDYEEDQSRPKR